MDDKNITDLKKKKGLRSMLTLHYNWTKLSEKWDDYKMHKASSTLKDYKQKNVSPAAVADLVTFEKWLKENPGPASDSQPNLG